MNIGFGVTARILHIKIIFWMHVSEPQSEVRKKTIFNVRPSAVLPNRIFVQRRETWWQLNWIYRSIG